MAAHALGRPGAVVARRRFDAARSRARADARARRDACEAVDAGGERCWTPLLRAPRVDAHGRDARRPVPAAPDRRAVREGAVTLRVDALDADLVPRPIARVRVGARDRVDDVYAVRDSTEDRVLAVEPGARVGGDDEELRPVRVRP